MVPGRTITKVIMDTHHEVFLHLATDSDILNIDSNKDE
jgi:hypothetical protein